MTYPIHFVDVTGTLQELGPGAKIQFNARNGTRQEIVLVDPDTINKLHSEIHTDLWDSIQHLSARADGFNRYSALNTCVIRDLDGKMTRNDRWVITRMQSLYDLVISIEMGLSDRIEGVKWLAVASIVLSSITLLLSIVGLFV